MWEIYSRADLVLAWLGTHDEVTKHGIDRVNKSQPLLRDVRLNWLLDKEKGKTYQSPRIAGLKGLGLTVFTSLEWDHFSSVLSRQRFSRVCLVQELLVAKKIFLCGGDIIDSSMILRLGQIIHKDKLLASIRSLKRNGILAVNVDRLAAMKLN